MSVRCTASPRPSGLTSIPGAVLIGRVASVVLSVGICAGLASCGSGVGGCLFCTSSTVRQFAYVANAGGNNVSAYSVNTESGALTAVPGSPFAAGTRPTSVALVNTINTPIASFPWSSVQFAYVVNSGSGSVSAYSVDAVSGALASLPGSPFAAGSGPISITLLTGIGPNTGQNTQTFAANVAYVVNHDSNNVSAFTIDSTKGTLAPLPGSPFAAGGGPVCLTLSGHFAYVVDNGSNGVSAYSLDFTTGALTPVPGSPFTTGASPVSLTAVETAGQSTFVYVANSASGDVSGYSLDAGKGALAPVAGSPFPAGNKPVAVTVGGGFAYVLNQGGNNISGYAIDTSTGSLTAVAGSPFAVGANPVQLTVYNGVVYAVNAGDNSVSAFAVGPSGALTPLPGSPYTTGTRPTGLTTILSGQRVTPGGHQYFALVPNGGSNDVSAYTLDAPGGQFNGSLSAVSGSPFVAGTNPESVAAITTTVTVHSN
jgi:6-phosphogluconolactonase (cycloisomerase 2 family)